MEQEHDIPANPWRRPMAYSMACGLEHGTWPIAWPMAHSVERVYSTYVVACRHIAWHGMVCAYRPQHVQHSGAVCSVQCAVVQRCSGAAVQRCSVQQCQQSSVPELLLGAECVERWLFGNMCQQRQLHT